MSVGRMAKPMNTRNLETRAALPHTEGQWESELKCIQPTKQKPSYQDGRAKGKKDLSLVNGCKYLARVPKQTPRCQTVGPLPPADSQLQGDTRLAFGLSPITRLQFLLCHPPFTGITFLICKMMCLFQAL